MELRLIAWEVTRRCPMSCRHCRGSAVDRDYTGEMSTEECFRFLDGVAAYAKPIMILTGGEPMERADIFQIAEYGTHLGLRMVMAPCGLLMDRQSTRRIIASGIQRISLSIDGADRETHDAFRQTAGAFDAVLGAARLARDEGLEFQVNTTVTRLNVDQLEQILELAISIGAVGYHPFLLVPTGRGQELADLAIDPQEYERVLTWIYERSLACPIQIKPTCAPHYYRILRQREKEAGRTVSYETHGLNAMTKGCLGGQSFAFVSHTGRVQICGFLDLEAGDIRRAGFDFREIWEHSQLFASLRDPSQYEGKCGICEYLRFCGGCRARAFAVDGNYLAEEPYCVYLPKRHQAAGRIVSTISDLRGRLLEELQQDFPLRCRPFQEIGSRCGLSEAETIEDIRAMLSEGLIREISALFDGRRIGYRSTLVALRAEGNQVERLAERINRHPGVSHNYLRNHLYNIWFTLSLPRDQDLAAVVEEIVDEAAVDILILPSVRTFKLKVHLRFRGNGDSGGTEEYAGRTGAEARSAAGSGGEQPVNLSSVERFSLAQLEHPLPITARPWREIASRLDVPERDFLALVKHLKRQGVIRRIAAVLRHRRVGYGANGMACFNVQESEILAAGNEAASIESVSHCYQRKEYPQWPYSLYTMVHARTREQCNALVQGISRRIGCTDYQLLYSIKEYKKQRIKYFGEQQ